MVFRDFTFTVIELLLLHFFLYLHTHLYICIFGWLIYLLYICVRTYMYVCALAVCLLTLIHLQNASLLLRRRWPRCFWFAFYGFPIFFAVLHAHKSRCYFNGLVFFCCFRM